jgi:glycerol-3-phosphate O-acyltransferase
VGARGQVVDWTGVAQTAAIIIGTILVYEWLRSIVKRAIKRRFERDLDQFLKTPDLYHQHFKFTNKLIIKQQLLSDPEVNQKILEYAQREGQSIEQVRQRVDGYIEEIIPSFNLLSYYKLGYNVARAFIHLLYDPVVDHERRRILDRLPKGATPVYIMNHRSNVDFVLLAYILAGKVSVSYAVGEWARVWPLEHLFKSFGSYLVRRGYKEDLYHKILERYVQFSAAHGVAQAIFPEGKISRDGHLLEPKLGLLHWLSGVEAEARFDRRLVFIPVGVNYDWVLEDYNLVAESEGRPEKKGWAHRLQVIVAGPFIFFGLLVVNGVRRLAGRLKLHGYASLSFGEPVRLQEFMEGRGVDLRTMEREERKPHVAALGEHLIERVGQAVPATPATILAMALLESGLTRFGRHEAIVPVLAVRNRLREAGVRFVVGSEFDRLTDALERLETEAESRHAELVDVERAFVAQEEAEEIVELGLDILRRNKILRRRGSQYEVKSSKVNYLRYYANSIAHHVRTRFTMQRVSLEKESPARP